MKEVNELVIVFWVVIIAVILLPFWPTRKREP